MRVKRYVVDTMPDAMQKIRDELGVDAVILSTKEMKIGGFMGMFRKKRIEVVAASEGNDTGAARKGVSRPSSPPLRPMTKSFASDVYMKSSESMPASVGSVPQRPKLPAEVDNPVLSRAFDVLHEASATSARRAENEITQVRTSEPRLTEEQRPPSASTGLYTTNSPREERLLEEIREMKTWLEQLAKQQKENRELPEPLSAFQNRLLCKEFSPQLVEAWVDKVYDRWLDSKESMSEDELMEEIQSCVSSSLEGRLDGGIGEHTRIVYIAGPTGVGKTTTIAKLAADQIFRARKKVGFITADTYRISAVEQLRTYASILNVPIEVVQSPGDVQRAFQRLEQCDIILMDTAGRNYLNEIHVAELHSLLNTTENSETYLVLSLTSKTQDMERITEHFSRYGLKKVIFTKLDETESVGPMFNLLEDYPVSMSYITNGQNVPDDLLVADSKFMIDLVMGAGRA
ncbi:MULTISPECIES: flagellar biosynthesis protein FlhF [unclassified Paenibacillus]|uniref:flagellar biosynthesis protein FlhF n=1 Tax=unclassified Paenibacillus TaxID=185978 RepID=UPI000837C1F4|nr:MULTISPECIES: flagellar biosynthesis protein FlhF [unclassified Paenibacillus]NWL86405.1 flagellar biosynthesis protein FlhF [Paenibacillus sp. 79R4]